MVKGELAEKHAAPREMKSPFLSSQMTILDAFL
jgi:hypothetical protein